MFHVIWKLQHFLSFLFSNLRYDDYSSKNNLLAQFPTNPRARKKLSKTLGFRLVTFIINKKPLKILLTNQRNVLLFIDQSWLRSVVLSLPWQSLDDFPALGWHWLQFLRPFPAFDTDYTVASSFDCPFLHLRLLLLLYYSGSCYYYNYVRKLQTYVN